MSGRLRVSPTATWLTFVAGLAVLTWAVDALLPQILARYRRTPVSYVTSHALVPLVFDYSGGRNFAPLFEYLPELTRGADVLVAYLGDSTIGGAGHNRALPKLTRVALERDLPGRDVQMIDLSTIGLYAQDALVLAAKALAVEPDVLVYAVTPRVVPAHSGLWWYTGVGDLALQADVVQHLGLARTLSLVGLEGFPRTAVTSWWAPARFRTIVGDTITNEVHRAVSPSAAEIVGKVVARPPPAELPRTIEGAHVWKPEDYAPEPLTRSSRALVWLFEMCARHGRCLVYHGPLNPAARDRFPPELADPFWQWLSALAARTGVPLLDHRDALPPEKFRVANWFADPIHPTAEGWNDMADIVAGDIQRRLSELGR